jgi:hypothetical protein
MAPANSRDERVNDLFFLDQSAAGDPGEEGLVRYVNADLKAYIGGVVVSLISGTGLTAEQHKVLRQLIHFIDDGPAEGFASGAYRETTGTVFPTVAVWYVDSGKTHKIVELLVTWTGIVPTTETWKMYAADGTTVLAQVVDTISYSGIFETSRTRAITVY